MSDERSLNTEDAMTLMATLTNAVSELAAAVHASRTRDDTGYHIRMANVASSLTEMVREMRRVTHDVPAETSGGD